MMPMNKRYNLGLNTKPQTDDIGLSDDELGNLQNQAVEQDKVPENYETLARKDLESSRTGGITKEQLDQLHKHEAANMWTSLFMNFVGAANGIKGGEKYAEPLHRRVEQERQGLMQQQSMANEQGNRAAQEQRMALGDVNLSGAKRDVARMNEPLNMLQKAYILSSAKRNKLNIDPNELENATQADYERYANPVKDLNQNELRQAQLQNAQLGTELRSKQMVPFQNPDGSIGYGFASKLNNEVDPLAHTIVPQVKREQNQQTQKLIKTLAPAVDLHSQIRNYDTATEGFTPEEARKVKDLAGRMTGAIAGKFDITNKGNPIINLNQALSSINKLGVTQEFNTPENPAIGEAAFRLVKSYLSMAAASQASKEKAVFDKQFTMGNSFGGILAGQAVPEEKLHELAHQARQKMGGWVKQAIVSSDDQKLAKEKAKELFGGGIDNYLDTYENVHGPGYKGEKKEEKKAIGRGIMSAEEYLNSLGK